MEARRPLVVGINTELKPRIGELLKACPPDLREGIGSIDFKTLDRSDDEFWQLGVSKILRAAPVLLGEGGGHKFSPTMPVTASELELGLSKEAERPPEPPPSPLYF